MTRFKFFITLLVAFTGLSTTAFALVPPWYFAKAVLEATYGSNPCIKVGEPVAPTPPKQNYQIELQTCATDVAAGLALFAVSPYNVDLVFKDQNGLVFAFDPNARPNFGQLGNAFDAVLKASSYFVRVRKGGFYDLAAEFKPEVIQIRSDNIADPYGLNSFVAASLFREVIRTEVGGLKVGTTTSPK